MVTDLTRTPGLAIRRELRREVNFGCPAPGCGSPYLTYHHFDPPWRVGRHHDPPGRIALCWTHHQVAESGAYTMDQLREMKQRPYLSAPPIQGRFEGWNRRRLAIFAGTNWFFDPPYVLSIARHVVIGISQAGDYSGLDLDVRSVEGVPLLQMQANDWNVEVIPEDLVCGNRGNSLEVDLSRHRIRFDIAFRSFSQDQFTEVLDRTQPGRKDDVLPNVLEWPIAVCTIEGSFVWPSEAVLYPGGLVGNRLRHLYQESGVLWSRYRPALSRGD